MTTLFLQTLIIPILIAVSIAALTFLLGYRLVTLQSYGLQKTVEGPVEREISQAVDAIAGDNIWSTKLDLARAYLETGQLALAKTVILDVVKSADVSSQEEARYLLKAYF